MSARTRFSLPSRIPPRSKLPTLPPKPTWSSILNTLKQSTPSENDEKSSCISPETQEELVDVHQKNNEPLFNIPPDTPKQQIFSRFTHVALPNIAVEVERGGTTWLRWEVIKEEIHEMKRVVGEGGDVGDAIKQCILAYNPELTCSFGVLYDMIEVAVDLFGDDEVRDVVKFIGDACLGVDGMRNGVKLLKGVKHGGVEKVELGRLEIVTLLACGFLCTYPGRDGNCHAYEHYPRINFDGLFDDKYRSAWGWGIWVCCKKSKVHRLLCIFNYFRRMYERNCSGDLDTSSKVSFERRTLSYVDTPEWGDGLRLTQKFCDLEIHENGVLEESFGCLQIDFANKFVGGSTLGHGVRMEEIMFSQSPELIVTQLFTKVLDDNECVIVNGVERFSVTEGYGPSFRFVGEYFDEWGSRVGIMDAVKFEKNSLCVQLEKLWVDRELTKVFVTMNGEMFVASGKWGAGVFNGDPLLKCLVQWMGASVAGVKELELYTFGDGELSRQLTLISNYVKQRGCSVGEMYGTLERFGEGLGGRRVTTLELFEYICSDLGTEVKEFGVDTKENSNVGMSAKWYVVELVCRLGMALKGVSGVVAVGVVLGWVGQQWVGWGRDLIN